MSPQTVTAPVLPNVQLGYILPTRVGDAIAWQFYRACPPQMMLVAYPINLGAFTREGVASALASLWPAHDFLVERRVDRIVQGGIPVSAIMGREWVLRFLDEAQQRSPIPTSADFEEVIEAFGVLGCRKIAVAAKWDDVLMSQVADYLRHAGLEPLGWVSEAHTAAQVMQVGPAEGHELALALGRNAFRACPQADALLLAGGSWISAGAVASLEQEFGRPVVTNPCATWWAAMRQAGLLPAHEGQGMLIDGLRGPTRLGVEKGTGT